MQDLSRFLRVATLALLTFSTGYGQVAGTSQPTTQIPMSFWQEFTHCPMIRLIASLFESRPVEPAAVETGTTVVFGSPAASFGTCSVAPLDPIEDPAAQQLEAATGSNTVDVTDMVPAAARALDRFEARVASVGGTMVLKSAYRPASYQHHLQNVWYKWMTELRNNHDPACQDLRAQVQEEFQRHHLIETQHPVSVSDHTRGLAFDATVELPPNARIGRRKVTLDTLAHLAGLLRPAIIADPVHFKFMGVVRSVVRASVRPVRRGRNA